MAELKNFFGSPEETQLKRLLKQLKNHTLLNHVIESCNATTPVSFTKAAVLLQVYDKERSDCLAECDLYALSSEKELNEYSGLMYHHLFKSWIFNKVAEHGLKTVPKHHEKVFLCLLNFFRNKQFHEKAIVNYQISSKGDESGLCAVLAEHFFSQLIPGHSYVIDENATRKPRTCPCRTSGCRSTIRVGNTAIGSSSVWHGYADIFLDQKVPVALLSGETSDDDDLSELESESGQPVPKKMKFEKGGVSNTGAGESNTVSESTSEPATNESAQIGLCVEVKNKVSADVLLSLNVIDQVIAETITNAFMQVNTNQCLKGRMIPTFGCSQEHIVVFMYDPENDILLQSINLIRLFEFPVLLSLKAAVEIWLFLNFTTFVKPKVADKYELSKSRFHNCVRNYLSLYKKVICKEGLDPADTNFLAQVAIPRMSMKFKIAAEKKN